MSAKTFNRNRVFGIMFSVAGSLLIAVGGFMFISSGFLDSGVKATATKAHCEGEIRKHGFQVQALGEVLNASNSDANFIEENVWRSSMAMGRCAGYTLANFCAGQGCVKPGVSFSLRAAG